MTYDPDWLTRLFGPRMRWKLNQWRKSLEGLQWEITNRLRAFRSRNKMCPRCRLLLERKEKTCPSCGYRFGWLESTPWGRMLASSMQGEFQAVPVIIGINVLFYGVGLALSGASVFGAGGNMFTFLGADSLVQKTMGSADLFSLEYYGEYWRLVTANFLHAGIVHLFFNMYFLSHLGPLVERLLGREKFVCVYFISGVGGLGISLPFLHGWPTIGASGAIFGLIGSALACGVARKDSFGLALRNEMVRIIIFVLVFGFIVKGVNNAGHIAGGILGALVTLIGGATYPRGRLQRRLWDVAESASVGLTVAAFLFMLFGY